MYLVNHQETLPYDWKLGEFYNASPKNWGAHQKIAGQKRAKFWSIFRGVASLSYTGNRNESKRLLSFRFPVFHFHKLIPCNMYRPILQTGLLWQPN